MKNTWLLVRKDFKRKWKNPVVIFGFLLIPVVFTFILGLVFGGGDDPSLPRVKILAADNDNSVLSELFLNTFTQGELKTLLDLVRVEEPEGRRLLDKGKASAFLLIPENFGADVWDGQPVEILLLKNPSEQFLPQIAEEVSDITSLLLSSLFSVFKDELSTIRTLVEQEEFQDADISALSVQFKNRFDGIAKYVLPPVVALRQTTVTDDESKEASYSVYSYIFPAISIMFLLFICNVVFEDTLREKESGTLLRMSVSPLRISEFIWSKIVTAAMIGMMCTLVLVILGSLIYSIRWGHPVLVLLVVVTLNILFAGFIAFLYSFVRTERQAGAVLSSVIILMALFGGSMVPLDSLPPFIKPISKMTVNYWGLEAFRMSIMGEPLNRILPLLLGITAAGILFAAISTLFLNRNLRKGLLR